MMEQKVQHSYVFVLGSDFKLLNIPTLACQVALSIGMDRCIRHVNSLITLKQCNEFLALIDYHLSHANDTTNYVS